MLQYRYEGRQGQPYGQEEDMEKYIKALEKVNMRSHSNDISERVNGILDVAIEDNEISVSDFDELLIIADKVRCGGKG